MEVIKSGLLFVGIVERSNFSPSRKFQKPLFEDFTLRMVLAIRMSTRNEMLRCNERLEHHPGLAGRCSE
jgi:hypothetical protein